MSSAVCIKRARRGLRAGTLAMLAIGPPGAIIVRAAILPTGDTPPAALCAEAIQAAEMAYRLPPRLLAAMGEVESGRVDQTSGRVRSWPWTVNTGGHSLIFDNKEQAVEWVRQAAARGVRSVDTGCLQVNLQFHPDAFDSLDDAFDPARNVDYAARFLLRLHGITGDWKQAAGFYHSQTPALAVAYEARVERRLNGAVPWPRGLGFVLSPHTAPLLGGLSAAWQATLDPAAVGGGTAGDGAREGDGWTKPPHARPPAQPHAKNAHIWPRIASK